MSDEQRRATTGHGCQALNARGGPCSAAALSGREYCFYHDPERAVERVAAQAKGGHARHGRTLGPAAPHAAISVATTADIVKLVERAINDALSLENSLQRARTVGYLALAACKAMELNELADRVAALEMVLKAREATK